VQDPRCHAVDGGGAGLDQDRAALGVVAGAHERLQPWGEPLLDRVVRLADGRGAHVPVVATPGETEAVMGRASLYVFTYSKPGIRIVAPLRGVGKTRPAPVRRGTGAPLEEILLELFAEIVETIRCCGIDGCTDRRDQAAVGCQQGRGHGERVAESAAVARPFATLAPRCGLTPRRAGYSAPALVGVADGDVGRYDPGVG